MRVAIVHDYLKEYGGAERVVEALHGIFPEAPIYTAYFDLKGLGPHAMRLKNWDIRTSWLQKMPGAGTLLSPLRIFAPKIFESFDLSEYDVVISSSAIYYAQAVKTKPSTLHIAYIHTPPRYLYNLATSFNYKKRWWTRIGAAVANHVLRIIDFEINQKPDILVANSENVQARIKKFYRREAVVIYPPVEVDSRQTTDNRQKKDYYLSLSRLWKGKGVDIAVKACTKLDLPLKVVGSGPERGSLKKEAGKHIEFLGHVSDEERIKLYSEAKALIVASEDEDFGITVVEAQALGTPVIALKSGGYLETVVEGKTGEFFEKGDSDQVTVDSLIKVLEKFDPKKYDAEDCINQAEKFSEKVFRENILELIQKFKK